MRYDPALPTLANLLETACFAEVARRIGKPRDFVFRLRHGQLLRDQTLIAALARALHHDELFVRRVCVNDVLRDRSVESAS